MKCSLKKTRRFYSQSVPEGTVDLDLSDNQIYFACHDSVDKITRFLRALPTTVKSIDLSDNGFLMKFRPTNYTLTDDALVKILAALPQGKAGIRIKVSDSHWAFDGVKRFVSALPVQVDSVDLSQYARNVFFRGFCEEEWMDLLRCFPNTVKEVLLDDCQIFKDFDMASTPKRLSNLTACRPGLRLSLKKNGYSVCAQVLPEILTMHNTGFRQSDGSQVQLPFNVARRILNFAAGDKPDYYALHRDAEKIRTHLSAQKREERILVLSVIQFLINAPLSMVGFSYIPSVVSVCGRLSGLSVWIALLLSDIPIILVEKSIHVHGSRKAWETSTPDYQVAMGMLLFQCCFGILLSCGIVILSIMTVGVASTASMSLAVFCAAVNTICFIAEVIDLYRYQKEHVASEEPDVVPQAFALS